MNRPFARGLGAVLRTSHPIPVSMWSGPHGHLAESHRVCLHRWALRALPKAVQHADNQRGPNHNRLEMSPFSPGFLATAVFASRSTHFNPNPYGLSEKEPSGSQGLISTGTLLHMADKPAIRKVDSETSRKVRICGKFARTSPQLGVLTAIPVNEMVRRLISTLK